MTSTRGTASSGALARLVEGATYLPRGIRLFARMPDSWLLGMLPGLLAALVATAVLVGLLVWLDNVAALLTPFADGWQPGQRQLLRTAVGALLVVGYLVLVVFTFAAVANTVGQPFFEQISDRVERRLGDPPAGTGRPWWRTLPGATADSLRLLALTASFGAPLFVLGFVPVIGQTVIPVAGALVGGFFLAGELLAIPLERRGLALPARLRLLRQHLPLSVGFGVACFLLFLVPVMNLVAMPGAIVGGTLLTRRLLPTPHPASASEGQPEGEVPAAHPRPERRPDDPEGRGGAST